MLPNEKLHVKLMQEEGETADSRRYVESEKNRFNGHTLLANAKWKRRT